MESNLEKVFEYATEHDVKYGLSWYPYANYFAKNLSRDTGISLDKVCGVISALSPNNKWERNLVDAKNLILGYVNNSLDNVKVCTFDLNKQKALRILAGQPISEVLKGPKTWNFYNCILNPSSNHVTIDFHAANIHDGEIGARSLTAKEYQLISDTYIKVATKLQIQPSALQAILWVTWREKREEIVSLLIPTRKAKQPQKKSLTQEN